MSSSKTPWRIALCSFPLFCTLVYPQLVAAATGGRARSLIRGEIDESKMATLAPNVRPEARPENDRGVVADNLSLEHMVLLLERPAEREAALDAYMKAAQTKGNPNFHRWLTADEIGREYGPSSADIETVSGWLRLHGFQVNRVSKSGTMIDFSGSAGQVLEAFKTEIHNLEVNGESHIGNLQMPQIPAALRPAVAGIASLNDFYPHPAALHAKPRVGDAPPEGEQQTRAVTQAEVGVQPPLTVNPDSQLVTPADIAAIYNIAPLYQAGITGAGQTVVAIEPTNLYSTADVAAYRKAFIPSFTSGSLVQSHPAGCPDPGLYGPWLFEAAVDIESIMASAPDATVVAATCASTMTNFGSFIALEHLIDEPVSPAIISISIEECETSLTETGNLYINYLYQQAAAQGSSIFVSSSDSGSAGCDNFDIQTSAINGIAVNGAASTPYNVAVGGTDFGDTYAGTNARYWSNTNGPTYGSAKSYIPEIPWNDSCASTLIANYEQYAVPYGTSGFCNSLFGENYLDIVAGSGGPSGCATGAPKNATTAVSGTCTGRAKPNWQEGLVGVPKDGVRDLPDVSLFAADGIWGHYYVFCFSDAREGGSACSGNPLTWGGGGGTSASAPLMAGIQALVNQKEGGIPQGNPNYVLYGLGRVDYGLYGKPYCSSLSGEDNCTFHDVTLGDNNVDCTGPDSCYTPSGTYGVLSVLSQDYEKAYNAHIGWDFATGIGTLDVRRLVDHWASAP